MEKIPRSEMTSARISKQKKPALVTLYNRPIGVYLPIDEAELTEEKILAILRGIISQN